MRNIAAIILAAGEGARMKSLMPKVLNTICGKPIIRHIIETINSTGIEKVIVVVGYRADLVKAQLERARCVKQAELRGTGDAVLAAKKVLLKDKAVDSVLVSYGDSPLLTPETIKRVIERHTSSGSGCTLLTSRLKNPTGYGRIVRSGSGRIVKIVEELDASIYEKVIEEINVGVYCFNKNILFESLAQVKANNRKKEYYLTDAIAILTKANITVDSVSVDDPEEFLGINTRADLIHAEKIARRRLLHKIMEQGVTIIEPENTYVEDGIEIKKDTVIYPYTFIEKGVKIGRSCSIGPFARLRSGVVVDDDVSIGNFAEIARSHIGRYTKIRHQCYIGDSVVGKNVNIGAGAIVANYDGKAKHRTVIEDNAFIGSGTILIAPVKIGKGAVTGAGSVVTRNRNVPAGKTVVGIPAKLLKRTRNNRGTNAEL